MKVLIIPDVHGRTFWRTPVSQYKDEVDKIIFLGDYLDPYLRDFDQSLRLEDAQQFALSNLKEIFRLASSCNKVQLLIGNHDFHYIYPAYKCSRKFEGKLLTKAVDLFHENIHLLKVCDESFCNGVRYVYSHAGIMKKWLAYNELTPHIDCDELNSLMTKSFQTLWQVSMDRGGKLPFGSCIWADFNNDMIWEDDTNEYVQIFGHTYSLQEDYYHHQWMLDCAHAFLLWDDNHLIKL